jgi:restriction system protein
MSKGTIGRTIKFAILFAIFWFFSTLVLVLSASAFSYGRTLPAIWAFIFLFGPLLVAFLLSRFVMRRDFRAAKQLAAEKAATLAEAALLQQQKDRWAVRQALLENVKEHRPALTRNIRNAIRKNDYGVVIADTREEAIIEFLASTGFTGGTLSIDEAIEIVMADIEAEGSYHAATTGFDSSRIPVSGVEFEHWVAASLRGFGWKCELTSGSGDQGIDVIAQKGGIRLGIQCKLYSGAVGTGAVQEAISGMHYYGLSRAAVLTNATFTRGASDLAASANVILLSHHEIPHVDDLVLR